MMVLENFLIDADILWDRAGKELYENPEARTGRIMRVQVTNRGVVEDLTGYTLNLGWKSMVDETKFGLDAFEAVGITKGIFELEYTSGMLTNIGTLKATLQLVPVAGNTVESDNFVITVTKSAVDAEAIQSETSFTALAMALVDVNAWNATISGKAEKDYVDGLIGDIGASATFKGKDTNANILAKTGMAVGDEWYGTTSLTYLRYNGTAWIDIGTDTKYGNNSIATPMLQNGAVTEDKTSFINRNANLLDVPSFTLGKHHIKNYHVADYDDLEDRVGGLASNVFAITSGQKVTVSDAFNWEANQLLQYRASDGTFERYVAFVANGDGTFTATATVTGYGAINLLVSTFPNRTIPSDFMLANGAILPAYEPYGFFFDDNVKIANANLETDLQVKIANAAPAAPAFDEPTHKLLLPPKMYFIDGLTLPLYKDSIISNTEASDTFKTVLINIKSDNTPSYKAFEDTELSSTVLSPTFKVAIKQKKTDVDYYKDITKSSVPATQGTGKTTNYLIIGDSITGGLATHFSIQDKLNNVYGVNSTTRGTLNYSEGRPGWRFKNFIGRSNKDYNGVTITRSTSGKTSTNNQNPFLKLADATDIANHPNWCFRNTGAETEKSYTEDTDKTGNFYIFDFAWYLSAHGITTPDTIMIELGTNDIQHESEVESLANSKLGLDIIIKQVKAALPNVKLGIIPITAWNYTQYCNAYWNKQIPTWIENCVNDVIALQATYNNLHIIGAWCHMSRFFNFPYAATSAIGIETKATKTESVHFSTLHGKAEYVNAVVSWYLNTL